MAKFLNFEETAKALGISTDELSQLREQHGIHGYRDGSTWKFKEDEVQRVVEERTSAPAEEPAADSDSGELVDLPLNIDEDEDSADVVLLSEHELGESDPNTSSTIIGKSGQPADDESDVKIFTEDENRDSGVLGGSDVALVPSSGSGRGSDVELVVSESPIHEEGDGVEPDAPTQIRSDVDLENIDQDEPTVISSQSDVDIGVGTEPTQSPSDAGSELSLGSDALGASLDEELSIGDDDFDLGDLGDEDSVSAIADDAEEMVLDGGPGSSDITQRPADSGISLASVSDSGISLEAPLASELDEASLEVGEDDEFEISGGEEMLAVADDEDSEELQEVGSDDDFLLTPVEGIDAAADESDDSGSQVIALDSESDFGSADLLGEETPSALAAEESDESSDLDATTAAAQAAPVAAAAAREKQFSGLAVMTLGFAALFIAIPGMMMFDLMRNMWVWDSAMPMNSALMDTVLGLFE